MLNWIAIYGGAYLFGRGGPLQGVPEASLPLSDDDRRRGEALADLGRPLQALHVGFFIALAALVVY